MKSKPTKAQAGLLRRAGLDPAAITCKSRSARLPFVVTFHGDGGPVEYWIYRDRNGKLELSDERPVFRKPRKEDEPKQFETIPDNTEQVQHKVERSRIDPAEFDACDTPQKMRALLLAKGIEPKETEQAVAEFFGPSRRRYKATRDEAEAWLKAKGLTETERAVVLAEVFDKLDKTIAIASEVHRNRKTVAKIRKVRLVQDCISHLQSGKPLHLPKSPVLPHRGMELHALLDLMQDWSVHGWPGTSFEDDPSGLKNALTTIHLAFKNSSFLKMLPDSCPPDSKQVAKAIVTCVRNYPDVLLRPEGRPLLEGLVDLLEAARSGCAKRRVGGLLPVAKPKQLARFAQKALVELGKPERGAKLNLPEYWLSWVLELLAERIEELQQECRAPKTDSAARVAQMREAHQAELKNFTDKELQGYLTDPPLEIACRLAAKGTAMDIDFWKRIRKLIPDKAEVENTIAFCRGLTKLFNSQVPSISSEAETIRQNA